jgi:hypothetical protein
MVTVTLTTAGCLLIVIAAQDVFHTLFHPAQHGYLSDWIVRQIWLGFRKSVPRWLTLAGPLSFVIIVTNWALLMIVGFSLIYRPQLPRAFAFASGLDGAQYRSFLGALIVSIGSLITLSTGVYSTHLWIQAVMGIESICGFALLTASVSWILSIYPVLEHRKSLAHEASLLHFCEVKGFRRLVDVSDSDLHQILVGLASQLITSRNELSQFPITYYFHEDETQTSLAGILPYMSDIAEQSAGRNGAARIAAVTLGGAIDDYLRLVAHDFLRLEFKNRKDILRALADDHMREAVRSPGKVSKAA